MELLVMIAVFALVAAVCVQAFVYADRLSRTQTAKAQGALIMQNAAELLKSTGGDYEAVAKALENFPMEEHCKVEITPLSDSDPYLASAEVRFFYQNEMLLEITVAWQEVSHGSK